MALDWFESERDLLSLRRELDRLKRRARARLLRTLGATALATAALVYIAAHRVPLAESRILIRVTEGTVMREDAANSVKDLGQFLSDSALSNRNLSRLVEKHGLYPLDRARGEMYALGELRSHLSLEVMRNQFLEARGFNSDVRTARIAVRFRHEDPAVSFAVCSDLAQLIIDSETRRREESSRGVAGVSQRAVNTAVAALNEKEKELAASQLALGEARRKNKKDDVAALQVDIWRLGDELKEQAKVVHEARVGKERADLRHALDSGRMNMLYQIVDERPPPPAPAGKSIRLAMIGLACFLILLPLCAIAVGAFDSRIHDREDVQRLGLEVVGHVPRFSGYEVGTLQARRAAEHRRTGFRVT